MAQIFGSNRTNNPDPVAVGLRVQQSLQGAPITIGCGRVRAAGNLTNYDGFVATPVKGGGKGGFAGASGKGNTGQYSYTVYGIVQLAEGGVKSLNRIFNGNAIDFLVAPTAQELIDLNAMGVNTDELSTGNAYNTIFHPGNWTDGPDSTWTAAFPDQTPLAYPGQAYVIFPKLGLGSSPSFPSFNFDYTFDLSGDIPALGDDANAADWIAALLSNPDWGVQGFSSDLIGDFDTARHYWRATGLLISVALTAQTSAQAHLGSLMPSLNAGFRWRDGLLDIVPYGDVAVTGNGYTYTPDTTPVYDIGVDDYLPNQGSLGNAGESDQVKVAFSRADESQVPNIWRIEYLDRANLYNPVPIEHANDAQIAASGISRYSDKQQQHWFCLASAASVSVALQLHRAWTTLNSYQFTLGKQFVLLDVLDLLAITEPALGLQNQLVRITEIQENADGSLTFTVEEVPLTASAPVYARQPSLGIARNTALAPGSINAPAIFELPGQLSQALQVQFAVSGQNPDAWGGCTVWISSDGEEYSAIGPIDTPARMGALTAALPSVSTSPSGPTRDTTNTLSVDLSESLGQLVSGSSDGLAAFATLCLVEDELIAFQTATLTSTYNFDLTTLERGCYGTQSSVITHAIGAPFVRVDDAIFRWDYTNPLIGKTVYFKFTSFNIYGTNEESLADVTAYSHVLSGTPTPNGIALTSYSLTQAGVTNTLALAWAADPLAVSYIAQYSTDGGATFTTVNVKALTLTVPGLGVSSVVARVAGVSANSVDGPFGAAVTVTGAAISYAVVFEGVTYAEVASARADIDAVLAAANDDQAAISSAIAAINAQASASSQQIATSVATALQIAQAALGGAYSPYAAEINVLNASLGATNLSLADANAAIASVSSQLTSLSATVSASLGAQGAEITSLGASIATTAQTIATKTDATTASNAADDDANAIAAAIQAIDAGQQIQIVALSASSALAGVAQTQASIVEANSAIATLKSTVFAQVGQNYAAFLGQVATQATQNSAFGSEITSLTATVTSNYGTLSSSITALGSSIATTAQTIATKTDATTASSGAAEDQTSIAAAIAAIDTGQQLQALSLSASSALAGVAQTQASIVETNSAIATLKSTVFAQAGQNYAAFLSQVATQATQNLAFASEISSLSATVSGNYTSLSSSISSNQSAQATQNSTFASEISTLTSNIGGINGQISTINTTLTSQATQNSTFAGEISTLTSDVGGINGSISSINSTLTSQASTLSSLSSDVTSLSASAVSVSAGGSIDFVAQAAPSGAFAAWSLQVTASGQLASTASLTLTANSDGSSSVYALADQFAIGDPATNTVPFQTLSGGGLMLNGVEQVNGSIVSATKTSGGQPVLEIDFINGPIYFRA
jgi:hypothetical protein